MSRSIICPICSVWDGCTHFPKKWDDTNHLLRIGEQTTTEITNPQAILQGAISEKETKPMNSAEESRAIFIVCNLCNHRVLDNFLTQHIGKHIENRHIDDANTRVADFSPRTTYILPKEDLTEVKIEEVRTFLEAMPPSKVKDVEIFSFRKIKEVSAISEASKDGRYSDFTLMVWFADGGTSYNASYVGGHISYFGKSSERLQVHLTYDSLERYYTISGKVYKKSSYSDHEMEEGTIPNRVCDQDELMSEMRKIFLFFKLSPMLVYKHFLKILRQGHSLISEEGKPLQTITVNHTRILEEIKKGKFSTSSYSHEDYHGYGC